MDKKIRFLNNVLLSKPSKLIQKLVIKRNIRFEKFLEYFQKKYIQLLKFKTLGEKKSK